MLTVLHQLAQHERVLQWDHIVQWTVDVLPASFNFSIPKHVQGGGEYENFMECQASKNMPPCMQLHVTKTKLRELLAGQAVKQPTYTSDQCEQQGAFYPLEQQEPLIATALAACALRLTETALFRVYCKRV